MLYDTKICQDYKWNTCTAYQSKINKWDHILNRISMYRSGKISLRHVWYMFCD